MGTMFIHDPVILHKIQGTLGPLYLKSLFDTAIIIDYKFCKSVPNKELEG